MENFKQAIMVYQEDLEKLTPTRIAEFIRHHYSYQRPRLQRLLDYYQGHNDDILEPDNRRNEKGKADHRAVHSFAKYIADFQTSYSVGNAINLSGVSSDSLDKFNQVNDINTLNYDLFLDMSTFGRAYEYIYHGEDGIDHSVKLDPRETFVIYDTSVDPQPVMAVRYHEVQDISATGTPVIKFVPETWTKEKHVTYKPVDVAGSVTAPEPADEQVQVTFPVIEYKNNAFRQGDYENVLTLIDLYDAAQSDTANYMTDFNEALLVIEGNIDTLFDDSLLLQSIDPNDEESMKKLAQDRLEQLERMRQANMLLIKSGIDSTGKQTSADAKYIHKEYDSTGTEVYKKRLASDIHKFSHTPDLTDENFASNASGVAMKYKILGTVELASTKRKQFERGLTARYNTVSAIEKALSGKWDVDANKINFIFKDNMPTDDIAIITSLVQAGAQLPQEYLYQYLPNVSDADEIIDMMDKQRQRMGGYATKNGVLTNGTSGNGDGDEEVRGQQGEPENQRTSN